MALTGAAVATSEQRKTRAGALHYRHGDATVVAADGPPTAIVHCVNDIGAWGAGFVVPLGKRFPQAKDSYRSWAAGTSGSPEEVLRSSEKLALGEIQVVAIAGRHWVVNLCGQAGIRSRHDGAPPVRYGAIGQALAKLRAWASGAPGLAVQCPRFGAGLAGGEWGRIEALLASELLDFGIPVTVFDLRPFEAGGVREAG